MYNKFLGPFITQEVVLYPVRRNLHLLNGNMSTFYQHETIPPKKVRTDSYRVLSYNENVTLNATNISPATASNAQQLQPIYTADVVSQHSHAVAGDIKCDFCDYPACYLINACDFIAKYVTEKEEQLQYLAKNAVRKPLYRFHVLETYDVLDLGRCIKYRTVYL